jgi:hypothetical protein
VNKPGLSVASYAFAALGLLGSSLSGTAYADDGKVLNFETHAAFFSSETQQKSPLDPQVFVAAPSAAAATGPQGITHVAGLRTPLIADAPDLPLFNASGQPLNLKLGEWLSPHGEVVLKPLPTGKEEVIVILDGLIPRGHYSLFENHFDQKPIGFTPLDGSGTANSFVASDQGKAVFTSVSPNILTHDNAVLVIYHSDRKTHGMSRGAIGVNAHHQLIVRP